MVPLEIVREVPFSLVCLTCDLGTGIDNYEEALAAGWTDICYAPDLSMADFLGLCPECRREQDQAASARA